MASGTGGSMEYNFIFQDQFLVVRLELVEVVDQVVEPIQVQELLPGGGGTGGANGAGATASTLTLEQHNTEAVEVEVAGNPGGPV